MAFIAKFFGFIAVIGVSYVFVEGLLLSADLVPALVGWTPAEGGQYFPVFRLMLLTAAALFVAVFFTLPALLSMFGHGGAWVKHVVARAAKKLAAALGLAFVLYFASSLPLPVSIDFHAVSSGDFVFVLFPVVLFVLLLFFHGPFFALLSRVGIGLLNGLPSLNLEFGQHSVASVEFLQMPTRHVRDKGKPERIREETVRFQRLVQTLANLDGKVELRLAFRTGRGRLLLTARGRGGESELQQRLLSVAKTHLHDFKASPLGAPVKDSSSHSWSILVEGAPEMVDNPLEPLARYFLENSFDGDYQVIVTRSASNPITKMLARRKQMRLARESGEQRTEQAALAPIQRSTSVRDYLSEMEMGESIKWLQRYASIRALKTWVYVTGHAETAGEARRIAEGASHVLQGTLSSQMAISALRARRARHQVRDLRPSGRPTILLPVEAVPYFWMPQVAMGTEVAPATEFELPPKLEGEIELGTVVVQSGETAHLARIPLDALAKHVFLTGMTGSGKTTSAFSLLMQLYQLGMPFLVIEPVKSEYRSLLTAIPELQIFTPGDEGTAPFRLNIFEPPSGVKVQTHLENLGAVWNSSFVSYSPMQYVVKEVLAETYKACGWSVANNTRGRPITLDDLWVQAEKVSRRLGYEERVIMDIQGAFRTRIKSLSLGAKAAVFNTIASIPLEDILRRPTVIELKEIQDAEEKAFVAALILTNVAEHIETKGGSKQLRHLTLIEEAHRLLPNISTEKGDPESADPRRRMVEQFANMLAEVRAYGEGLAIVEQIPTKIIPDVIKNTATKVAHRVPASDDREVMGGAMNLTKEQMRVFTALKPGEALVHLEGHPLPIRVVAPNIIARLGMPVGTLADEDVSRHMADYYLRNPLPRAPAKRDEVVLRLVDSEWFRDRFRESWSEWLRTGMMGKLTQLLIESAKRISDGEDEVTENAGRILSHAAAFYLPYDEKDRARVPRVLMRLIERSLRDGRRA